jgi:hypothetical protein
LVHSAAQSRNVHIAANSSGTFKRLLHGMGRGELLEDINSKLF